MDKIRQATDDPALELAWGPIKISRLTRTCLRNGQLVALTETEYRLLELLMLNTGRNMSAKMLSGILWEGAPLTSNMIPVYINYLRNKLGSGAIQTERLVGYRLAALKEVSQ